MTPYAAYDICDHGVSLFEKVDPALWDASRMHAENIRCVPA